MARLYNHGIWYTYILGSLSGTFYVGFTGRLQARVLEHKDGVFEGFTSRYEVDRLLYYESFDDPLNGIHREKQLKGWTRKKKIALIESMNPSWKDLSREWYEDVQRRRKKWEAILARSARVR
ncbi:MAG TPA: GIY-YIG nuclease family protein [Terriglobales bacterium]|nr:GIY-YIG nuclease family protein [Terriglobales bacterium]